MKTFSIFTLIGIPQALAEGEGEMSSADGMDGMDGMDGVDGVGGVEELLEEYGDFLRARGAVLWD